MVALASVAACGKRPSQDAVAEAAALSHGIDALRQAPNPDKAERLAALRQMPCSEPDLCELKRECERAYTKHVVALARVERVNLDIEKGEEEGLEDELDGARATLIEAEAETQGCVGLQAAAKTSYGLSTAP